MTTVILFYLVQGGILQFVYYVPRYKKIKRGNGKPSPRFQP
jgi:hypothetical protein